MRQGQDQKKGARHSPSKSAARQVAIQPASPASIPRCSPRPAGKLPRRQADISPATQGQPREGERENVRERERERERENVRERETEREKIATTEGRLKIHEPVWSYR